ncbi:diaminopimelate decarboxylase [Bacillus cereus]|nr:diaminopimelate decarboxylase [Bacillus cereus]
MTSFSHETIRRICSKFPTPLFLYDGNYLKEHIRNIQNHLHPAVQIFFSLKSNNNASIANLIRGSGCGIEVASKGELYLALKAGYKPKEILFSGPGKQIDELELAIDLGIYSIIIESIDELRIVSKLASLKSKNVKVSVRINPDIDVARTSIKMGGVPRQFGIDESKIPYVLNLIENLPNVDFKGIHVYMGTQILNSDQLIKTFTYTLELAKSIKDEYGLICEMIDLGGGLGIPYFKHEKELDFLLLAKELNSLIEEGLIHFPNTKFIIESGRYLVAKAGIYLTKVLYTKDSKGEKFLIVDGGLNHHVAATFRGRTMRNNFPLTVILEKVNESYGKQENVTIVGPLCTPEDCLAKNVNLPQVKSGDIICIFNSGAYCLSYSPNHFLGHPTPMEILLLDDQEYVIRERGNEEDLLRYQNIIKFEVERK